MRHCRRRGKVSLAGVGSSKRPLFWMIVAIAAACLVLRERAAFATGLGRFPRTLFAAYMSCYCRNVLSQLSCYV